MVTKQIDALGNVTTYKYDGNGNLSSKTDADGHTTEYTYDSLDLVKSINYNGEKSVSYRYNATGDLIYMKDWLGETTFEVDLMHRMKKATDHNGNTVSYAYDATGQQTAIVYPDGSTTTYEYDAMGRVSTMHYPNGWTEYYTYDAAGRLISVDDTHPSEKPSKTQKHTYRYDLNGNLTYEYMRGNGTGQAKTETTYTYDELDRLVKAHDEYGNSTREYTYDSLGNLTYETENGSHAADHRYNDLNQQISRSTDNWKTSTASEYDARGNLVLEKYVKDKKQTVSGQYTYDASNKMTEGVNANGEKSIYSYNGLGALMENTWVIAKNGYGYHDVNADYTVQTQTSNKDKPTGSNVKKTSTVKKQFVVDFTSDTYRPLQEHEVNGLDYRYVYSDKARLSVVVSGISNGSASLLDENGELQAYYHTDYLGTTDYLTSAVNSKVISWTNYNEWGEITHNAVLKCGQRELDLVKEYATHDYDAVLDQYYAKARFYDASNRRFTAQDPILDSFQYDISSYVKDPLQLDQYLYVKDNAVNYIDILGMKPWIPYPGFIHTAVQHHIQLKYRYNIEQTIRNTKRKYIGRADVISNAGSVWEIKPESYRKGYKFKCAVRQLDRYINNIWEARPDVDLKKGSANIYGDFILSTRWMDYNVQYKYIGQGIIIYSYDINLNKEAVQNDAAVAVVIGGYAVLIYCTGGAAVVFA